MREGFVRAVLVVFVLVLGSCTPEEKQPEEIGGYDTATLLEARKAKDNEFRTSPYSPVPESMKSRFSGLRYFDPNEAYNVEAIFKENSRKDTVEVATNVTGETRSMIRFGTFSFLFADSTYTLTAFVNAGSDTKQFFVPFSDLTNSRETYVGGRYLDIKNTGEEEYQLDFNSAYNPYCDYNDSFSCPKVPTENHLPFAVRAGEKRFGQQK